MLIPIEPQISEDDPKRQLGGECASEALLAVVWDLSPCQQVHKHSKESDTGISGLS